MKSKAKKLKHYQYPDEVLKCIKMSNGSWIFCGEIAYALNITTCMVGRVCSRMMKEGVPIEHRDDGYRGLSKYRYSGDDNVL